MDYGGAKGRLKPEDYRELVDGCVSRIIDMIRGFSYEAAHFVAYSELSEIRESDPTLAQDVQDKLTEEAEQFPLNPLLSSGEIYMRNVDRALRVVGEEINEIADITVQYVDEENLNPETMEIIEKLKTSKINFS